MIFRKKAQGATEYIIIVGVVIIIALIVVIAMGGIPGIGRGATGRAIASYWATADVAITDYAISAGGTDTVIVKNNLRNQITLTDVVVNSVDLETSTTTIAPGGSKTYTGSIAACTAGQSFSYSTNIYYQDTKTSAYYNFTGDGNKLEGTCAS
ncbi:class III signal peptide-containing protein [Candidatus Woesearchaeota archaeon]|nr:class III signal peptide-containing protein [Candidatus Woesearchaeota archaeon]